MKLGTFYWCPHILIWKKIHHTRRKSYHQYHVLNIQLYLLKKRLSWWHKIDTLHEISHHQLDWDALKSATKKSPLWQLRWAVRLAEKELPLYHTIITQELWTSYWRRHSHLPVSQRRWNMGKYQKGPSNLGKTKQSGAQPNLEYYTRNVYLDKKDISHALPSLCLLQYKMP